MISKVIKNRYQREIEIYIWKAKKTKAIMIIAHGASEHIYRYDEYATFLKNHGITVYGYNHLGHGNNKSEIINGVFFSDKDGEKYLIDDLEDVCIAAYQDNKNLPLIIFGHSMGSLIVRGLMSHTKLRPEGVIICGSLHPSSQVIKAGLMLAKTNTKIFGKTKMSKSLNNIAFGNFEKRISYNQENVEKYKNDKDCGMLFSNQAIVDLMELMNDVTKDSTISKMIKTKYYIISGKDDPFSDSTKQLKVFFKKLDQNKIDYNYKFYSGMKHEILMEDKKEDVFKDIIKFIDEIS